MDPKALAERLFHNAVGTLELYVVYLGERLGLYKALAEGGPATSAQLAERAGIAERYAREWLEHQAAAGLLEVDGERRYTLPPEHAGVLADRDDLGYAADLGVDLARVARRLPNLVEAFRTGTAPPPLAWAPEGRAERNRSRFLNLLGKQWLPAITDVDARLRAEPPALIADVACGTGWSSIATALAYPGVEVHGVDLDADAIVAAGRYAAEYGVADRVSFAAIDAAELSGSYDLVMIIEALHDMTRPVESLRTARELLADGGCLLVVDVLVEEEFTAPASERERFEYGWSVVACLPGAMGDPETAATGTVMRPATLRRYAAEAGFAAVDILPIETDYWRFYRLRP